ncbi:unnamed protein product [Closterium sp. NIES-53]
MAKATSGWYPEVDVARQAQTTANECTTVQVGPIVCAHLRACALLSSTGQRWTVALLQRWHTVDLLCWQVAFLQCWRGSSTQRWQAVDHAVLYVDQASCRVARPTAAIVTMVDPVANAGVADTLETCLADARKRHADGEYRTIPLLIVELGIRSQWATEHPSCPVSPRTVRNEGGVDDEAMKDVNNSSGKSRGDGEASCSMVGVAEPTVSLAPEAGEDFQAVAAAVQANLMAVLLDSGCSHHMMGTKAVFVDMAPSDSVKHERGFNGAL